MKLAKLCCACLLTLACQTSVQADHGLGLSYLFGYGGLGGFAGTAQPSYYATPPYFAMHPPVYYGERYTRPYGVSPFASWPQLQTNPAYAPQPHVQRAQVIANPYCIEPASTTVPGVVQIAPAAPLVIDNPYFEPAAVYTSAE